MTPAEMKASIKTALDLAAVSRIEVANIIGVGYAHLSDIMGTAKFTPEHIERWKAFVDAGGVKDVRGDFMREIRYEIAHGSRPPRGGVD